MGSALAFLRHIDAPLFFCSLEIIVKSGRLVRRRPVAYFSPGTNVPIIFLPKEKTIILLLMSSIPRTIFGKKIILIRLFLFAWPLNFLRVFQIRENGILDNLH